MIGYVVVDYRWDKIPWMTDDQIKEWKRKVKDKYPLGKLLIHKNGAVSDPVDGARSICVIYRPLNSEELPFYQMLHPELQLEVL